MAGEDAPARYRQSAGDEHDRAFSDAVADPAAVALAWENWRAEVAKPIRRYHTAMQAASEARGDLTIAKIPWRASEQGDRPSRERHENFMRSSRTCSMTGR
jgi:hypothetical protein